MASNSAIERCRAGATRNQRCRDHRFGSTPIGIINGGRGMASPPRVAGPDGMTMISGTDRIHCARATRDRTVPRTQPTMSGSSVWIDPRPALSESSTAGEAWPRPHRTGWDDDDPGTGPLRTRDPRSNGRDPGGARSKDARNQRSSTDGRGHGLAPTGWDDDDPGTARHCARANIERCRAGAARNQRCRSSVWIDPRPALSESSTAGEAWPRPHGWPDRMG